MSRIGKLPVAIPQGVAVNVTQGGIEVKGPKGTLTTPTPDGIACKIESGAVVVTRRNDERAQRALHGLARALLANAVKGVTTGWKRELDIQGIGYRATLQGDSVEFALGFSHPVVYRIPKGVSIAVEKGTHLVISGIDRQAVGQVAAEIRGLRPPEPYKGKGIRYSDEIVRKKVGKTGA